MTTDPDGQPYAHNAEQAEAHKLARAEGDGPVSNNTARAYLNAIPADKTAERDELRAEVENEARWAAHYLTEARAAEAERDHLRAEVERLRSDRDCEKRLRKDADELREDALERAERYRLATLKQDTELATERARLDWLESRTSTLLFRYSVGGWSISDDAENAQNLLHEYALHDLRAAIDAALKEDAK